MSLAGQYLLYFIQSPIVERPSLSLLALLLRTTEKKELTQRRKREIKDKRKRCEGEGEHGVRERDLTRLNRKEMTESRSHIRRIEIPSWDRDA